MVGRLVRADLRRLVRRRLARLALIHLRRRPGDLAAFNPLHGLAFLVGARLARLCRAGLGISDRHRRGSALCGHGPFRAPPDQRGVVCSGVSALTLNYLGQGAMVLTRSARRSCQSVLLNGAGCCAPLIVVLATARHHHRQPSGDFRRLFADPTGDPARPAAALARSVQTSEQHFGQIYHAASELLLLIGVILLVVIFKTLERAGLRLWHLGDRRDDHLVACWRSWRSGKCCKPPLWLAMGIMAPFILMEASSWPPTC